MAAITISTATDLQQKVDLLIAGQEEIKDILVQIASSLKGQNKMQPVTHDD